MRRICVNMVKRIRAVMPFHHKHQTYMLIVFETIIAFHLTTCMFEYNTHIHFEDIVRLRLIIVNNRNGTNRIDSCIFISFKLQYFDVTADM